VDDITTTVRMKPDEQAVVEPYRLVAEAIVKAHEDASLLRGGQLLQTVKQRSQLVKTSGKVGRDEMGLLLPCIRATLEARPEITIVDETIRELGTIEQECGITADPASSQADPDFKNFFRPYWSDARAALDELDADKSSDAWIKLSELVDAHLA